MTHLLHELSVQGAMCQQQAMAQSQAFRAENQRVAQQAGGNSLQIDMLNTAIAQSQMEIEGLKMEIGQLQQKLQLQIDTSNVSIKQLQDLLTLKTQDYQELQTDMMALQEKSNHRLLWRHVWQSTG